MDSDSIFYIVIAVIIAIVNAIARARRKGHGSKESNLCARQYL